MTMQTETLVMAGRPARPRISRRRAKTALVRYVLMLAVLFISLAPIVWPILTSFKAQGEDLFGPNATVLPENWSLFAYQKLFEDIPVLRYVGNSLTYAGLSVSSQLIFATMGGYMLSRPGWRGRWFTTVLVLSAMIFPLESIMLSLYTQVQMLGLLDTILGVWLPGFVGVFNVLIMRSAFMAVPDALEEAACIDGAGEFRRFFFIFLPATRGALVIVVLMSFISAWDDLLWPLIALRSNENFTLTLGLATLNTSFGFDVRVILAGAVIALVPVVVIFLACQRHFFRGVEEGGVKF